MRVGVVAVSVLVATFVAANARAAADDDGADDDGGDTDDAGDDAGDDDGAESAPSFGAVVRPRSGSFVAAAGAGDVVYVVDGGGVRASTDGGRTWRASTAPLRSIEDAEGDESSDDEEAADAGEDPGDAFLLQEDFGYVGHGVYLDIGSPLFFYSSAGSLFAFPYGTTGEEYLEFAPDSPAFWDPPWLNGMPRPDSWYLDPTLTAPLLSTMRARSPRPFSSDAPATSIAVDDDRPTTAFLAGPFGVERTDDAGVTWTSVETHACDSVASAGNGRAFALCGDDVVAVDGDGAYAVGSVEGARSIAAAGDVVVVAGARGIAISHDAGTQFDVGGGPNVVVSAVAVDGPRVWVGTHDGIYGSSDGVTFTRAADGDVATITARGGRVVVVTSDGVVESKDGGAFANVDVDGGPIAAFPLGRSINVVTADALSQSATSSSSSSGDVDVARIEALKRERAREPSAEMVLSAAHKQLRPLNHAAKTAWAPRVDVVAGIIDDNPTAVLDAVFLDSTAGDQATFVRQTAQDVTENGKPAAFDRKQPFVNGYVAVFLSWDLPSLFAPSSTAARTTQAHEAYERVEHDVIDALERRQRAVEDLLLRPAAGDDVLAQRALDVEEQDARLFALSGVRMPKLRGDARRALANVRADGDAGVDDVVAQELKHLGVTSALERARGSWLHAALPTIVAGGSIQETALDEDEFLDEIGLAAPWTRKSGRGHLVEGRARFTWDFPHTLNDPRADTDADRALQLRTDLALDAIGTYYDRLRAAARHDDGAVDELTAILAGLTGTQKEER